MKEIIQRLNDLCSLVQERITALDAERAEAKGQLERSISREAACKEKESELAQREAAVSAVEYSVEIVAKNESILKSNQQTKDELDSLIKKLGDDRVAFVKQKQSDLNAIADERLLQKRNSEKVKELEAELKQKIAEFNAKIKAVGV